MQRNKYALAIYSKQRNKYAVLIALCVLSLAAIVTFEREERSKATLASKPSNNIENVTVPRPAYHGLALRHDINGLDLVFEGGGAKGLAHVGAIRAMEDQRLRYRRIAGTSAGALIAMFVAAGYTSEEVRAAITERMPDGTIIMGSFLVVPESFDEDVILSSMAYKTLIDLNFPEAINAELLRAMLKLESFREAFSLVEFGGVVAGETYLEWIQDKLDANGRGLGTATFAEFYQRTGAELTIVAADMDSGRMLVLNHRTVPDLPVAWAARMSSSVPFAFRNVKWQPEWGTYLGENIDHHRIVDGGVSSNLPIVLMIADTEIMLETMGAPPDRQRVLGFLLDEAAAVPGLKELDGNSKEPEESPIDRHWNQALGSAQNLVKTLMQSQDNFLVSVFPGLVCRLPAEGFSSLQYDMSEAQIDLLAAAAAHATRDCLLTMPANIIAGAKAPANLPDNAP